MEEIKLLNDAFRIYNLNDIPNLSNKILDYILLRLMDNKENFEKMIKMLDVKISFDNILKVFKEAYMEKDFYKKNDNYKQGLDYYMGVFPMPIGNILVETNNVLDVVKYFVGGIKSRNTITISQTEYYELSLSNMILIIFVEALAKFNISRNTLMILPFEECYYDEFDEIIVIEDDKTSIKHNNFSKKSIIYIENNSFENEINKEKDRLKEQNIDFEIITGEFENAIDIIKKEKPQSVAIYTENPYLSYDFITLANSPNVFVNSSLLNAEELNEKTNKFYYKKKIMYPSRKEFNVEEYYNEKINSFEKNNSNVYEETDKKIVDNNNMSFINTSDSENSLIEVVNPWYKRIFERIRKILFRE